MSGRRLDEGFESDDEYERRRHGKSTDLDDPYATLLKQRSTDTAEGRRTPTASSEFQSRKSSSKRGDFGIVNIVQEATPIQADYELTTVREQPPVDVHHLSTDNVEQQGQLQSDDESISRSSR